MFSTTFLDLPPLAGAAGTVRLPGSKSISNRVLLLAALASGTTVIHDLLDSDDTRVMLDALRALGCGIDPFLVDAAFLDEDELWQLSRHRFVELQFGDRQATIRAMPVPEPKNADVKIALGDIRQTTLSHRPLVGRVALDDEAFMLKRCTHRGTLVLKIVERR